MARQKRKFLSSPKYGFVLAAAALVLGEPRISRQDRPILRQLGGFAYQGLNPNIGNYDEHFAWWGLLANMTIRGGSIQSIQMIPLDIDEGGEYVGAYNTAEFLTRRGFAEVATGTLATKILERFRTLSEKYGTEVQIWGKRAFIDLINTD
jgi:hypothetical protein